LFFFNNNISIIIPVYNAASFVEKAVESALALPEVGEILLIEDGSHDNSLEICKRLAYKFDKVKLFTHPGNINKGAGASRNIGINHAQLEFIAFLDADDYYLPNRFEAEKEIFIEKPQTDGVYGALGFDYYSEEGKQKYEQNSFGQLTTLTGKPKPNELFLSLTWLHPEINGNFSVVALTLRRSVFNGKAAKFGLLKMHEDTVFIMQLSLNCRLEAGIIDRPVALRGVHDYNRIVNNNDPRSMLAMWTELYEWAKESKKSKQVIKQLKAFITSEQLKHESGINGFLLWLNASIFNKYFLTNSSLFYVATKRVYGNSISKIICFIKDRIQVRIFKSRHNYNINV
jgi:glycosyltransferase involved in cell wall biosynthesis